MTKANTAAKAAQNAAPADVGAAPGAGDDGTQNNGPANAGAGAGADDSGAGADQAGAGASDTGSTAGDAGDAGAVGQGTAGDAGGASGDTPPVLAAAPERMRAVVLFSGAALSHRVGTVVEGPADVIDRLEIAGDVDSHPGAVEAALAGGATPVSVE